MRRKAKRNTKIAGSRDIRILMFLWRWKVATTHTLVVRYFPDTNGSTAYRRLYRLAEGGFICSRCDIGGRKYVWQLDKKGYEIVRRYLPLELEQEGYKSEHVGHDLVASAFHLGGFLTGVPDNVELFSEQQLRRLRKEDYPFYVSPYMRYRPDGYTCIKSENSYKIFTFETELNIKTRDRYGECYRTSQDEDQYVIQAALWLVGSKKEAARLKKILDVYREYRRIVESNKFFILKDFLKHGWDAREVYEQSTVNQIVGTLPTNKVDTPSNLVCSHVLLNTTKTLHRSKTYHQYEKGDFC